jgi:hypothetical protein
MQGTKPAIPLPPDISTYEPATAEGSASIASSHTIRAARGGARGGAQSSAEIPRVTPQTPIIPTRVSDLSDAGQEAYKEDREDYKLRLESYKHIEKEYTEEKRNVSKVVEHIITTVSSHLQLSCCAEEGTLRQWITALQDTAGVDIKEERARVRERYHAALKPMRNPQNWETWLSEYDQAATRAEALEVAEVMQTQAMVDDFLGSVSKVASTWTATFQGPGYDQQAINRKRMMKLFRDYMSLHYQSRGKPKSAFGVGESSYLSSSEPDLGTHQRDASSVGIRAPSNNNNNNQAKQGQGKPRLGKRKAKQYPERNTAAAEDICPACEQRHQIRDCYYVDLTKAPEWFRPNNGLTKLVQYKLQHDPSLQRALQETTPNKRPRNTSSSRSITPYIKPSHTPDEVNE